MYIYIYICWLSLDLAAALQALQLQRCGGCGSRLDGAENQPRGGWLTIYRIGYFSWLFNDVNCDLTIIYTV